MATHSCDLRVEIENHTEGCESEEQTRHQVITATRVFALISKYSTFAIRTIVLRFKIANIQIFHVLIGLGRVTDVLELGGGVLTGILKENLLATRVLKVGNIVNFVID